MHARHTRIDAVVSNNFSEPLKVSVKMDLHVLVSDLAVPARLADKGAAAAEEVNNAVWFTTFGTGDPHRRSSRRAVRIVALLCHSQFDAVCRNHLTVISP